MTVKVIEARNVNHAVAQGLPYLIQEGVREESRNGTVLVAPAPVVTVYGNPTQRVLFSPLRNANPFFHLMESLWMLSGRNDLAFPMYFNKKFADFSDDNFTVHGAYGNRWRVMFGMDQIAHIVDELREKPKSRRAVLQMWSALGDLVPIEAKAYNSEEIISVGGLTSKDVPCNTHAYFDLRDNKLNMTVCNRSNDVIWGAYGANAVHFSILQEYIATQLGVPVGQYIQFSHNFHAYTDVYNVETLTALAAEAEQTDYYSEIPGKNNVIKVNTYPLMSVGVKEWNEDLRKFMRNPQGEESYNDNFFSGVVAPMFKAYFERKAKRGTGIKFIDQIVAEDWRLTCTQWIARREKGN